MSFMARFPNSHPLVRVPSRSREDRKPGHIAIAIQKAIIFYRSSYPQAFPRIGFNLTVLLIIPKE